MALSGQMNLKSQRNRTLKTKRKTLLFIRSNQACYFTAQLDIVKTITYEWINILTNIFKGKFEEMLTNFSHFGFSCN